LLIWIKGVAPGAATGRRRPDSKSDEGHWPACLDREYYFYIIRIT